MYFIYFNFQPVLVTKYYVIIKLMMRGLWRYALLITLIISILHKLNFSLWNMNNEWNVDRLLLFVLIYLLYTSITR